MGPGRGKAREKGIVLSVGWLQRPLIHRSFVCSGEGSLPWGELEQQGLAWGSTPGS